MKATEGQVHSWDFCLWRFLKHSRTNRSYSLVLDGKLVARQQNTSIIGQE